MHPGEFPFYWWKVLSLIIQDQFVHLKGEIAQCLQGNSSGV
jgi:hypothetical protein